MPAWCSSRTSSPASRSAPYSRATTAQKCVRAGGKHNDLDNVGYTARHHTFFEMLGNFSFGDYFKERAIELAWNLITKEFGLAEGSPARHRLSRRRGGACRPVEEDRRASRIPRSSASPTSDNFWQMGDTGPCGPCSEIFIDQGDKLCGRPARQPGRGRRPVPRVLEPRLHAIRADRARQPRRPAQALDRYRHGSRAHRGDPAGRALELRHRPVPHPDRGGRPCDRRGARGRPQGLAPGDRRSPARLVASCRRRRAALERGPRLRAAPHHAPRHAPCAAARRQGAAHVPPRAGAGARDGRRRTPS